MGEDADPWLEIVPHDPATSDLLLRFERSCDVTPRSFFVTPVLPADVTLTADGRLLRWGQGGYLGTGPAELVIRQLSPSGLAQVQRDVLDLPALQSSADYGLEQIPNIPDPPGHGTCANAFWLGEGAAQVEVHATGLQGSEEGVYWVPSPERQALDELAAQLMDLEPWLGPAAWSESADRAFASGSYLFWVERWDPGVPSPAPPSVAGAAWPFDSPIDQFGDPVGQARCGHLDLGQAFEVLRLMRGAGVPLNAFGDSQGEASLDRVASGTFATGADRFSFILTPRGPDGYPSCTG
jgi:hypothetical protein